MQTQCNSTAKVVQQKFVRLESVQKKCNGINFEKKQTRRKQDYCLLEKFSRNIKKDSIYEIELLY